MSLFLKVITIFRSPFLSSVGLMSWRLVRRSRKWIIFIQHCPLLSHVLLHNIACLTKSLSHVNVQIQYLKMLVNIFNDIGSLPVSAMIAAFIVFLWTPSIWRRKLMTTILSCLFNFKIFCWNLLKSHFIGIYACVTSQLYVKIGSTTFSKIDIAAEGLACFPILFMIKYDVVVSYHFTSVFYVQLFTRESILKPIDKDFI